MVDDADGVREVEARVGVVGVGGLGDAFEVEQLSTAVEHRGHEHDAHVPFLDGRDDVLGRDRPAVAALDRQEMVVGVQPPMPELGADGVVVRREVEVVGEDGLRLSVFRKLVQKRPDQRVDVGRRRVGDDHFVVLGPDERRELRAEILAVVEPVGVGVGPAANSHLAPLVDDAVERRFGIRRDRSQRVAVHVELVGEGEPLAELGERVVGVAGDGGLAARVEVGCVHALHSAGAVLVVTPRGPVPAAGAAGTESVGQSADVVAVRDRAGAS